ncbi:MAG: S8 family serine peptidase [Promethearchaeota archaeon]
MRSKTKIMGLFLCALFLNYGFIFPVFLLNNLNIEQENFFNKIMFDKSSFKNDNTRIIINFKRGTDLNRAQQIISTICDEVSEPVGFDFISAITCEVPNAQLYKIAKLNDVEKIYLDDPVKLDLDPSFAIPYNEIFQLNQCAIQINSRVVPYTGQGLNISIIDTGIDFTHADLNEKMLAQESFVKTAYGFDAEEEEGPTDFNGHGTHCAGIATGTGVSAPTGYGIVGIAPNTKLLNAKCLNRFGSGYTSSVIAAIEWSINQHAAIISMSLGFSSSDPDHPVSRAVDNATKEGIVVVIAAGNSGPFFSTVGSPGSARSIITVGATNKQDKITSFSSRGSTSLGFTDPDVIAPGEDILAPIAASSLLRAIVEVEDYYLEGNGGNDYAILSGTSMSCPMVAGAAALLLEAFPMLNPYQVRIALMEGAESLGYTPNVEGAGRINVNNSYTVLLSAAPTFNISTVLPQTLPIPPLEFSTFPGDTYSDDFIILLGQPTNLSVTCSGNVSPYITLYNTSMNEIPINATLLYVLAEDAQFTNLEVVFDNPLNIVPGLYTGTIKIRDNDTQTLLETVDLAFQVCSPRGRIYFDCLHNSDSSDHVRSNFYNFTKLFYEQNIAITYGCSLLSFPLLSQYDLLILSDIELPLTPREIAAIEQYWIAGGNLLVLGSFYPFNSIESLNTLLATLDVGISYTTNNIKNSYDMGILEYIDDFLITNITTHPITNGVSQFDWLSGVALEVDSGKASTLAWNSTSPVIGVFNESEHKLICMGFERIFYDDFLSYSYNEKLILQTITWLLNDSSRSNSQTLRVEIVVDDPILELGAGNQTTIGFYVSDSTSSYIKNLVPQMNLSCQVAYYDNGWVPVWLGNASDVVELGTGAYFFNFSTNITGYYRVNVTIENISAVGIGIAYLNTTISMPKILVSSLTTTTNEAPDEYDDVISNDIYRNVDQVTINLTLYDADTIDDIENVTCYITSLCSYRSNIKYLKFEMENTTPKDAVEADFSLKLAPDYTFPAGSYHIFIETVDSSGNSDYSSTLLEFYVDNKYSVINWSQSTLKGTSLQYLKTSLSNTKLKQGSKFSVEISGTDTESSLNDMYAYVIIFSTLVIGITLYLYEPLWAAEVPFITDRFAGELTLPVGGISQVLNDSYTLQGSYIMLFLLLDSDGQYDDDSYAYASISIQAPFPMTLIIIIICVLAGLAVFIYIWFWKKK